MISVDRRGSPARTAVLIRTKDRPIFLARAIQSVLDQSDQDWCICVINDGGDRTVLSSVLAPFEARLAGKLSIVNFQSSEGFGKGKHLNAGIQATESEFIAIHDDDDTWDPNFLSRVIEEAKDHAAIVTQSLLIKERLDGVSLKELSRELYEPWQQYKISLFRLAESLSFPPIAFVFRRRVLAEIGAFDAELGPLEDWEFSLRLFSRFEVRFLEEPLAHYRHREGLETGSSANSRARAARRYAELDAEIRNRLLRQDLAEGKMGLGWLVNLSHGHAKLFRKLMRVD